MLKNLAILLLISITIFGTNAFSDAVEEVAQVVNFIESGKNIDYVQGNVEVVCSCCKWWNYCRYWGKPLSNETVHLYIRTSNKTGGEVWTKAGESKTDKNGYYSFGKLKNYCGPTKIKVPAMKHPLVVDYTRFCNALDNGRDLDVTGKRSCKK